MTHDVIGVTADFPQMNLQMPNPFHGVTQFDNFGFQGFSQKSGFTEIRIIHIVGWCYF